jgi:hypothetical protein
MGMFLHPGIVHIHGVPRPDELNAFRVHLGYNCSSEKQPVEHTSLTRVYENKNSIKKKNAYNENNKDKRYRNGQVSRERCFNLLTRCVH